MPCNTSPHSSCRIGYDDFVALHFNSQADFGSHTTQLGLLWLQEASVAAKVPAVTAVNRFLTAPTHDNPTDGEENDERGNVGDYLILGHVNLALSPSSLGPQSAKEKPGARPARRRWRQADEG